ncbi:MAG: hypothetical protein R3E89_05625 [Thiolinea sp.]
MPQYPPQRRAADPEFARQIFFAQSGIGRVVQQADAPPQGGMQVLKALPG